MEVRKYQERDRDQLIKLWQQAFPHDPPHNEPSNVLSSKLTVDDLVFVAIDGDSLVGGCEALGALFHYSFASLECLRMDQTCEANEQRRRS